MTVSSSEPNKGCANQCPTCSCGPRPSDKWIPWYIVAFFVVVVGVLSAFAWIAVTTEPGVVTQDAYQKGLHYDQTIAASDISAEIPWQASITARKQIDGVHLEVVLKDDRQKPINYAVVESWWVRPVEGKQDQHWKMTEKGNGVYEATGPLPLDGAWDVRVTVAVDDLQKQFIKPVVVE